MLKVFLDTAWGALCCFLIDTSCSTFPDYEYGASSASKGVVWEDIQEDPYSYINMHHLPANIQICNSQEMGLAEVWPLINHIQQHQNNHKDYLNLPFCFHPKAAPEPLGVSSYNLATHIAWVALSAENQNVSEPVDDGDDKKPSADDSDDNSVSEIHLTTASTKISPTCFC
jgi:hypothetical protein